MAGRRAGSGVVVLCLVLLMSFSLCFDCRKVAIRTFPADSNAYGRERRPVIGRRPVPIGAPMLPATVEGDGLEESKRRVPSCPDPLHNSHSDSRLRRDVRTRNPSVHHSHRLIGRWKAHPRSMARAVGGEASEAGGGSEDEFGCRPIFGNVFDGFWCG
ncbi:hypothetical protein BHE74_00042772 [Ensete ventricosum]|nr:hypothetical protein BHE74_00042772 [Ensete ventricosum]